MKKAIVYYTDSRLEEPIRSACQWQLWASGLPIICVSLRPEDFGEKNIVLDSPPGIHAMFRQILAGIEAADADWLYLCEHDVLYHPIHFLMEPENHNFYYFNTNVWRWAFGTKRAITYDHLISVSGLMASRGMLLSHYSYRLRLIEEGNLPDGKNPSWARIMGYEPGKPKRKGGILDEPIVEWQSKFPNIDIRHKQNITPQKMDQEGFRHKPTGWVESEINRLPGWEEGELRGII